MPEDTKAELLEERADLRAQVAALTAQVQALSLLIVEMHRDIVAIRTRHEAERPSAAIYLIERMTSSSLGTVALGVLLMLLLAMAMDVVVPGQSMATRVIQALPAALHGSAGTQAPVQVPTEGQTDAP